MDIIDDEGRLFGRANVIDVVVVLFVVALAVAGLAVAVPADTEQESNGEDRYGIVRFEPQTAEAAGMIQAGDKIRPRGSQGAAKMTVLDTYRTPLPDGGPAVVALVSSSGTNGNVLTVGNKQAFSSANYHVNGTVTAIRATGGEIPKSTTNVTLETTLSPETWKTIEVGDEYRVAGDRVARIAERIAVPTTDGHLHARIRLALQTRTRNGEVHFAGNPIRLGTEIPFRTNQYGFTGDVTAIGERSLDSKQMETPILLEARVPATTAQSITKGDTYELNGETVTKIDSVAVFPTGDSGWKRVQVGATVQTVTHGSAKQFIGQSIETSSPLKLRTNEYTLTGTVLQQGETSKLGASTTRNATVRIEEVSPTVANAVRVGATESHRNTTHARVTSKRTAPATVILTTDDGQIYRRTHPTNRDVTLGVELAVRQTEYGLQFHGKRLQTGQRVVFDFGSVTVEGTVQAVSD